MKTLVFDLWRDFVFAVHVLADAPKFTAVGVLSLTLATGVCSVFYSEINYLALRPLPVARDPQALVAFETLSPYPYFERYRDQRAVATSVTAFVGPVPLSVALDVSEGQRPRGFLGISYHQNISIPWA